MSEHVSMSDSFTCPICGRTSWNPQDARWRWCSNCQGYTEEQSPPGMRWVLFSGGTRDGAGRLLQGDSLDEGATYTVVLTDETYVFDGERYVLT